MVVNISKGYEEKVIINLQQFNPETRGFRPFWRFCPTLLLLLEANNSVNTL